MYVIQFHDGTFFQERGGNDWGRSDNESDATHFDTHDEAYERADTNIGGFTIMIDTGNGCEPSE